MSANLTNHGAAVDSKPLNERWRACPVPIREDIARHGGEVRCAADFNDLSALDLLAYAMEHLALQTASFGGFGDQGAKVDELVKLSVASHHRSWIMRPLEKLYDKLQAEASVSGEEGA